MPHALDGFMRVADFGHKRPVSWEPPPCNGAFGRFFKATGLLKAAIHRDKGVRPAKDTSHAQAGSAFRSGAQNLPQQSLGVEQPCLLHTGSPDSSARPRKVSWSRRRSASALERCTAAPQAARCALPAAWSSRGRVRRRWNRAAVAYCICMAFVRVRVRVRARVRWEGVRQHGVPHNNGNALLSIDDAVTVSLSPLMNTHQSRPVTFQISPATTNEA